MSISGFFAYPNDPRISETIAAFCEKLKGTGLIQIETWEQMRIGGKLLVSEICKRIEACDLFCADITRLNPNVLFEIGFAIASKKRIWLIRDTSIPSENSDFKQFRILTNLGYREYLNSNDILHAYYNDLPHDHLEETVYDEIIEPTLRFAETAHILYLKSFYEDESSIKVTQYLAAEASKKRVDLLVDDPRETSVQPLSWYAKAVHAAQAVLCHLTSIERENSKIQNAKHSLVAGLAYGFKIPLLLLIENNLFGPTDYKDLIFSYKKPKDAVSRVEKFILPLEQIKRESQLIKQRQRGAARQIEELAMLQIGEPIAEHEEETVADTAFIETAPYHSALNGSQTIFVGRKGVGKTANFMKIARVLSRDKRIVLCEIKPLSYELESLVAVAKRFEQLSRKGFLFESLWKFLVYSELARHVVQQIYNRPSGQVFGNERPLVSLVDAEGSLLKLDFAARLDQLSRRLIESSLEDSHDPANTVAVSELLHSGVIKHLLDALLLALQDKLRVVILIDNLDKAWDRSEETQFLSYFFLGLLSAVKRIASDFKNRPILKEALRVSLCVFVRADIFEIVLKQAREPDKIQYQRITWEDRHRLKLLADSRLLAAAGTAGSEINAEKLWEHFFVPAVYGVVLQEYIFSVILQRPRDLLYFLRSAISAAVSRRHVIVSEDDFVKAEEDYSEFVYQSLLVELREKIPSIEHILGEFMGGSAFLNQSDITAALERCEFASEVDLQVLSMSLSLNSFLEIEVPSKGFVSVTDENEYARLFKAASNAATRLGKAVAFRIHRAFRKTLLIGE